MGPILTFYTPLIIFTGAGSGFGAAISKAFAAEGARVLVCDINQSGGEATVATNPTSLAFHKMDVTKSAEWTSTMQAVMEKFGTCDILVNNAGWSYDNKATTDVTEEEFERVFDVNVKGVYLGCNAWVNQAIQNKSGGVIINISSVGATRPRPGLVWYNASKGAVSNVGPLFNCAVKLTHIDSHISRQQKALRLNMALMESELFPSAPY